MSEPTEMADALDVIAGRYTDRFHPELETLYAAAEHLRVAGRAVQDDGLPTALHLLRRLVDYEDSPCRFDHHGYCQEHHLENPCTIREARDFLALRAAPSLPEPSDD